MFEYRWVRVGMLALLAAGCGGGDDDDDDTAAAKSGLAGIYQTVSDDYYQPCDGEPANTGNEPPYFHIVDDSLFGTPFIDVYRCTSGELSSCDTDDTASPFIFAAQKQSNGVFHSESSSRSGTETDCTASFDTDDVAKTADGVTLTSVEHSAEWSGADCAADFDDAIVEKTKTLPCFQREVRGGKLIAAD